MAAPATPQDAYDLLRTAILEDDPALVIESRALYRDTAHVSLGAPATGIDGPRVVRAGSDVTIVAWSRMVAEATSAAEELERSGISAEVVDLRWIAPLQLDVVFDSLGRTGKLVLVHEANLTAGFGAEIAARVCSDAFDLLDAPIRRVAARDSRVPSSPVLQRAVLPAAQDIVAATRALAAF